MKALITPEFKEKASIISQSSQKLLGRIIDFFEASSRENVLQESSLYHVLPIGDIYVGLAGDTQIYFTFGTDEEGEYVLLMDIAETQKTPIQREYFAQKNPISNHSLNPIYNHSINPIYNHSINPIYNHSINPIYNHSINPIYNHSINPIYNHSINPIYNHSINPVYNHSINPIYNHSINPVYNRGFGGPYLYSSQLQKEGFLVNANEKINIIYNMKNNHIGFCVIHGEKIQLVFDNKSNWNSYLVSTEQDPILRFGTMGKWIGMIL